jgi:hypothetical protein
MRDSIKPGFIHCGQVLLQHTVVNSGWEHTRTELWATYMRLTLNWAYPLACIFLPEDTVGAGAHVGSLPTCSIPRTVWLETLTLACVSVCVHNTQNTIFWYSWEAERKAMILSATLMCYGEYSCKRRGQERRGTDMCHKLCFEFEKRGGGGGIWEKPRGRSCGSSKWSNRNSPPFCTYLHHPFVSPFHLFSLKSASFILEIVVGLNYLWRPTNPTINDGSDRHGNTVPALCRLPSVPQPLRTRPGTGKLKDPLFNIVIVTVIKSRRMRCPGHLARVGREEKRIQDFGGENWGKETTWDTQA